MKKIINYKKYDTETATEIGAWSQGIAGTFEYVHESLFRKNNGEYFLHGEGGAASKYQEKITRRFSDFEIVMLFVCRYKVCMNLKMLIKLWIHFQKLIGRLSFL